MRTIRTTAGRTLVLGLLLVTTGCNPYTFGWPDLWHPGGFASQRWKAEVFDPYPDPNLGPLPPGTARPPWYETPAPQVQDNYWSLRDRFGRVPPPKEATTMP